MNPIQILSFIKIAQAGTGAARDVNYLFLAIVLFLSLLLGLVYLYKAIVNFIHHYNDQNGIEMNEDNDSFPFDNGNT